MNSIAQKWRALPSHTSSYSQRTARHAQTHSAGYGPGPVTQLRISERSFTAQKPSLTRCASYEHPETIQLWVAEELATRPINSQAI